MDFCFKNNPKFPSARDHGGDDINCCMVRVGTPMFHSGASSTSSTVALSSVVVTDDSTTDLQESTSHQPNEVLMRQSRSYFLMSKKKQ